MIALRQLLAPLAGAAFLLCTPRAYTADTTLLIHGHIYTADPAHPWAQALVLRGARIDAVGSDREILAHRRAHAHMIDLKGRTVVPGLIDSHTHMLFAAMEIHGFNLSNPEHSITPDHPDELVAAIKAFAAAHADERLLIGRADFNTAPPAIPGRALLDAAVNDRPVIVHDMTEHALWVNTRALELAGITDEPVRAIPEPTGHHQRRQCHGRSEGNRTVRRAA